MILVESQDVFATYMYVIILIPIFMSYGKDGKSHGLDFANAKSLFKEAALADSNPCDNLNLVAKGISFAYDKRKIIDDISLSIPARTTTAIVGPSGGEKPSL